jgi:outer membrane protein insertion porin family
LSLPVLTSLGCARLAGRGLRRFGRSVHRLLVALTLLACLASAPSPAAEPIGAIEIAGNRTVTGDAIRARLAFAVGGPYEARLVDRSLQALFATGLFSDVRFDRRGTTVVVTVVERPLLAKVDLEGNSAVERSRLQSLVHLKAGARYASASAHADALRIRDHYRSLGRLLTSVDPRTSSRADGRIDLLFVIKEGAVTKVDHIAFVGNRAFSERQLRDVITTSQSGWFDILKAAAFYDPERIEHDRELLRQHYLKNGFPDARIPAAEAIANAQGTGYSVQFTIDEGERYLFRGAEITTEEKIDTQGLESAILVRPGSPYSREQLDRSVEKMTLALSDRGYPAMQVRPVEVRDGATHTIAVGFHLAQGPRMYVERIDIVGNAKTKDFVIRRQMRIEEGDAVNAFMLERARSRVQALGLFKSVALKRRIGSTADRIIVTVEVVEDDTRNLAFGVGYSLTEGVLGDISVTERNLFGNGQTLSVKFAAGAVRTQADVGFTEPRLLGSNYSAGFDLFYRDVDFTTQASYKSQKIGGDVRLGYPITDEWTAGVNYTYSHNTIYDVGSNASAAIKEAVPGFPNSTASTYNSSSVGYSLTYDTRDNKKRPTSGVYYSVAQDLAGVGGDVRFIRSVGEARGYYAVSDDITLMGRATGGAITGWGGTDVRLLDLFYKGGESVRGFAPAGFGPRDTLSANQDALGGRMYFTTTAELLFPLPGVPDDIGLRGDVFTDAGSLWGVTKTATTLPGLAGSALSLRASAGAGLAWESPIGNLRVDYAFPILKQSYDKVQPLSFGLMPF